VRGKIYKKFEANSLSSQAWGLSALNASRNIIIYGERGWYSKLLPHYSHLLKNKELLKMRPKNLCQHFYKWEKSWGAAADAARRHRCWYFAQKQKDTRREKRKEAFHERWLSNLGFLFITGHVRGVNNKAPAPPVDTLIINCMQRDLCSRRSEGSHKTKFRSGLSFAFFILCAP